MQFIAINGDQSKASSYMRRTICDIVLYMYIICIQVYKYILMYMRL